ncbi:MAG: sterol desaturase family protein [Saprospiraceae bacterium]
MNVSDFFLQGQTTVQFLLFSLVFIISWNLENIFGVTEEYNKWKHSKTNILFMIPGGILQIMIGLIFAKMVLFENNRSIGFLPQWGINSSWKQLVISFVVLDFFYWLYHFLMHKIKLAWRFHAVHHSDKVMDVTTSLREHPGETIIRLLQYILVVCFLGTSFWIVTLHQFIQIISKIIVHSNWRLPASVDKWVSMIFLTPNMHHVHHHEVQPYTDSNYGDLLSIWDRLFGTYKHLGADEVNFGLDVKVFDCEDHLKFKKLLKVPFTKLNLTNK